MKTRMKTIAVIACLVVMCSLWASTALAAQSNGTPFNELWNAISNLQNQINNIPAGLQGPRDQVEFLEQLEYQECQDQAEYQDQVEFQDQVEHRAQQDNLDRRGNQEAQSVNSAMAALVLPHLIHQLTLQVSR